MHIRIGLLLILLGFALSAQVGGAPAAAQSAASAALQNEAMEIDQNASEEPDEGFWDGMVSSILDFFGDDSEDEEERRQDRSPNMREAVNAENTPTRAVSDPADDGRTHELAVRAADTAPSQPGRRLNLRRVHVSADNVTPSHVYQATRDLVSEIVILRQAMNVTEVPGEITLQQHQAPIHAYAKCLEVLGKAARVQRRLGMIPVDVKHIPVKVIDQSDVHNCVQTVIKELRRIKRQMVIKTEIQPAPLVGGKAPSLIYEKLMSSSLLLDGLVGRSTTPKDLYLHVLRVQGDMELIADALGVPLEVDAPVVTGGKEPTAVAQQVIRATSKMINLQSKLGMEASSVPAFSLEQVTAADVYDATNFLLAETVRIKTHLNIRLPSSEGREAGDKTTADVFSQVLLVIKNLSIMSMAADEAG